MEEDISKLSDQELYQKLETLDQRLYMARTSVTNPQVVYMLEHYRNTIVEEIHCRNYIENEKERAPKQSINLTNDELAVQEKTEAEEQNPKIDAKDRFKK